MIEKVFRRSQRVYHGYIWFLGKLLGWRRRNGTRVMEREWDNLVVLDACRADAFEELNPFQGNLEFVKSVATETPQWLKRNFTEEYDDIVYISGNPYVSELASDGYFDAEEHFHDVYHVWRDGWDENLGTVPPGEVTSAFRRAREDHPEKRFVLHYMQPHEPFIGDTRIESGDGWKGVWDRWTDEDLETAYRDNLRLVLEEVEELVGEMEGKTMVTSDHGEILNPRFGLIRHPKDVFLKELYRVPWLEIES